MSGAFHAPLNGELLRQRLEGGAIKKNIKNAPPNKPLELRVASPSDSVIRQPVPLTSARRSPDNRRRYECSTQEDDNGIRERLGRN